MTKWLWPMMIVILLNVVMLSVAAPKLPLSNYCTRNLVFSVSWDPLYKIFFAQRASLLTTLRICAAVDESMPYSYELMKRWCFL